MNGEQIASAQNIQIIPTLANENLEPNGTQRADGGTQRINHSRGDDCCANGVGSKAQELIDRVPPCMGKFSNAQSIYFVIFCAELILPCVAQVKSKGQKHLEVRAVGTSQAKNLKKRPFPNLGTVFTIY